MGFFSWKTAGTQESVMNVHTGQSKTTYLLQPNGQPPIKEGQYHGFGLFGGVDAYNWLVEVNARQLGIKLSSLNEEQQRYLGIFLEHGSICVESESGDYWAMKRNLESVKALSEQILAPEATIKTFPNWEYKIDELGGATPNQLVEAGRFKIVKFSDLIQFPIKLSFNPKAKYEDYPASERCPLQGFFL